MLNNPVKKSLRERKKTFGTWIQIGHAAVAEILSNAGFDWIAVDCEHTDINMEGFTTVARGMFGRKAVPLARVRENDALVIRQVLDMGAQGVIVPLVNNAEDAKRAVASAKYPPQGIRGFAFCRANNWGTDFDKYAAEANQNTAVIVMIESRQAVECIDEIISVEGVDGVFIGPYDLSGSYGIPGKTNHPDISAGCKKVVNACRRAGKSAGIHVVIPTQEAIREALEQGFTFIALGVDSVFLNKASRASLETARAR